MVCRMPSVLIVDDEPAVCDLLHDELSERGYLCTKALNGDDALAELATRGFDVVLLDIKLPGISGIEVLREMRSNYPNTTAIMITGINDVDTAVETMKLGASDYLVKPFPIDRVNTSISTALEVKKHLPGKREREIPGCVGGEEEGKQVVDNFLNIMNNLAYGVGVKYDFLTGHSEIVTQRTIEIARQLGIAEKEIQRWATARAMFDSERNRVITSSVDKPKRSLFAESIMSATKLLLYEPNLSESQN